MINTAYVFDYSIYYRWHWHWLIHNRTATCAVRKRMEHLLTRDECIQRRSKYSALSASFHTLNLNDKFNDILSMCGNLICFKAIPNLAQKASIWLTYDIFIVSTEDSSY